MQNKGPSDLTSTKAAQVLSQQSDTWLSQLRETSVVCVGTVTRVSNNPIQLNKRTDDVPDRFRLLKVLCKEFGFIATSKILLTSS